MWQPQPEPQPPIFGAGIDGAALALDPPPTEANTESKRTEFSWPCAHFAGSLACDIARRSSKVSSHVRHRNSYTGMIAV